MKGPRLATPCHIMRLVPFLTCVLGSTLNPGNLFGLGWWDTGFRRLRPFGSENRWWYVFAFVIGVCTDFEAGHCNL